MFADGRAECPQEKEEKKLRISGNKVLRKPLKSLKSYRND